MTSKECFNCGDRADDFAQALVKVTVNEKVKDETVDGKRKVVRRNRERWCCIECLLTTVASESFEEALDKVVGEDTEGKEVEQYRDLGVKDE